MVLGRAPSVSGHSPSGWDGAVRANGGGPANAQSHMGLTMPGLGALAAWYPAPDFFNAAKFSDRLAFTSRSHCADISAYEELAGQHVNSGRGLTQ